MNRSFVKEFESNDSNNINTNQSTRNDVDFDIITDPNKSKFMK